MVNPPEIPLLLEHYAQAAKALHVLSPMLLFEFARHAEAELCRDQIARNFIARADTTVRGIFRLWEIGDQADCWILHRALLDRLFHLDDLRTKNQFDVFNDWSFKIQYEAAERLRSDSALQSKVEGLLEELTPERKARYRALVKNPPDWRRPRAEDAAKRMGLTLLYKYGYDYGSRHVHPMANDGQQDFHTITNLEPKPEAPGAGAFVLSNSILVASLILQEALDSSSLSWRPVVYDAIEGIRNFLPSASPAHHTALARVGMIFTEHMPLAQRGNASP